MYGRPLYRCIGPIRPNEARKSRAETAFPAFSALTSVDKYMSNAWFSSHVKDSVMQRTAPQAFTV